MSVIIERFQTRHALQEEQETKNSHASTDGAPTQDAPGKEGCLGTDLRNGKEHQ